MASGGRSNKPFIVAAFKEYNTVLLNLKWYYYLSKKIEDFQKYFSMNQITHALHLGRLQLIPVHTPLNFLLYH